MKEFLVDFEKAINDFKTAGGKLDVSEKIRYWVRALSPSCSYIGDFIDVKSKMKEKIMNKSDNDKKGNVSTFTTKIKGQCFNCGKTGHYERDCWQVQRSNRRRTTF